VELFGNVRQGDIRQSCGDPVADRIMSALERNPEGLSNTDIYNIFGRHVPAAVIMRAMDLLERKGLIRGEPTQTGGRPNTVWKVAQKAQ
jgi:hypothetical protein